MGKGSPKYLPTQDGEGRIWNISEKHFTPEELIEAEMTPAQGEFIQLIQKTFNVTRIPFCLAGVTPGRVLFDIEIKLSETENIRLMCAANSQYKERKKIRRRKIERRKK
jgi:hypothetical protein